MPSFARRPSAAAGRGRPARRRPAAPARTGARPAGSPRAPTRASPRGPGPSGPRPAAPHHQPRSPGCHNLAGPLVHRSERMRALVRVRPDHDHAHRPFVWLNTDQADHRRTTVMQGESHASIKSRRRSSGGGGRHELCRSDQADDAALESQPAASPRTNRSGRTSPPDPGDSDSDSTANLGSRVWSCARVWSVAPRHYTRNRSFRATTSSSPQRVRKFRSSSSKPRASRCLHAIHSPSSPSVRLGSAPRLSASCHFARSALISSPTVRARHAQECDLSDNSGTAACLSLRCHGVVTLRGSRVAQGSLACSPCLPRSPPSPSKGFAVTR
jgi:hypothetical protein